MKPRRVTRASASRWSGLGLVLLGLLWLFFAGSVFFGTFWRGSRLPVSLRTFATAKADCLSQQKTGQSVWEDPFCYPATASRCTAAGGFWGLISGATGDGCNAIAPDAGAACRTGHECASGHCLAILSPSARESLRTANGQPVKAAGICAGVLRVRGCNAEVTKGMMSQIHCQP